MTLPDVYPGPTAENLACIPDELKGLKQWVLWQGVWRPSPPIPGQKPTKVPIDPQTLTPADVTDPTTWETYEYCVAALPAVLEEWEGEGSPEYWAGGIGFVLTPDDPYVGIDLDKCVDPATGEIASWAQTIVAQLASYTEISVTSSGLHTIVEGPCLRVDAARIISKCTTRHGFSR